MLLSFILIPFVTALLLLFIKNNKSANTIAIVSTLGTLVAAIVVAGNGAVDFNAPWIPVLNAQFLLHADGLAKILETKVLTEEVKLNAQYLSEKIQAENSLEKACTLIESWLL